MERAKNNIFDPADSEAKEINSEDVWPEIFVRLTELASLRKKPVRSFAPFLKFAVINERSGKLDHTIRVNPVADTKDGKPRAIIIDANYDREHTQQIYLEAEWEGDTPVIKTNDHSKMPEAKSVVPYEILGMLALHVIHHRIEHAKEEISGQQVMGGDQPKPNFSINVPYGYSTGIN